MITNDFYNDIETYILVREKLRFFKKINSSLNVNNELDLTLHNIENFIQKQIHSHIYTHRIFNKNSLFIFYSFLSLITTKVKNEILDSHCLYIYNQLIKIENIISSYKNRHIYQLENQLLQNKISFDNQLIDYKKYYLNNVFIKHLHFKKFKCFFNFNTFEDINVFLSFLNIPQIKFVKNYNHLLQNIVDSSTLVNNKIKNKTNN